jgi:RNA polymerase sigma factor (TIGR02999 family)
MEPVTELLARWRDGDAAARDVLLERVYGELRRIAQRQFRHERGDHTLQATALVNEAFLRLVGQRSVPAADRGQFFAVAAQMMRRVLVDHARARRAGKRGGGEAMITLVEDHHAPAERAVDLVRLDEALATLAQIDPDQARLVELRYFAGLTIEDAAAALGVSPATVKREWTTAKAWLRRELAEDA